MAKITGTDNDGNIVTLEGVNLWEGLLIEDIDKDLPWTLSTSDNAPSTHVAPHIGGTPDDR